MAPTISERDKDGIRRYGSAYRGQAAEDLTRCAAQVWHRATSNYDQCKGKRTVGEYCTRCARLAEVDAVPVTLFGVYAHSYEVFEELATGVTANTAVVHGTVRRLHDCNTSFFLTREDADAHIRVKLERQIRMHERALVEARGLVMQFQALLADHDAAHPPQAGE